ncbi:MAG: DNA/RNA non-specific endonuclease [Polyangiaceae bacterium]
MKPFDVDRLEQAARRYSGQTAARAEPKAEQRADRRKRWLATNLSAERARATVSEAEARGAPADPQAMLATLARERIVGSNDLRDVNYLELAIAIARAVCRIRVGTAAGSGSLVGPGLLLTNHHVLENVEDARNAEAQFDYQENASGELLPIQSFRLDPERLFHTDPTLDFTLVAVLPTSARGRPLGDYPWLKLIPSVGKCERGEPLNIIQHPRGGLKQIALRNNEIIEVPGGKADFLYYTTDTEPGSSGSPCFNDQWELVALHHSGVPRLDQGRILKRDRTPFRDGVDDPALIDWIANEGARVSAILTALRAARLAGSAGELLARLLEEPPPNPVELGRSRGASASAAPAVTTSGPTATSVSLSIPLTITLTLGDPVAGSAPRIGATVSSGPPAPMVVPAAPPAEEGLVVDPDWSTREGYDRSFLEVDVPLPKLSTEMKEVTAVVPEEYRVGGDKYVLAYHHFSLAMNKKRRFAWYSAANIDGARRPTLPKRSDDKWAIDPRIDDVDAPEIQCGEELYATAKTDRGHLTRYLDVAWGTKRQALAALADTFHFSNACLQLSAFNQGKDRWQGIEQYLLENKARKEKRRMSVMTGPLFKRTDPVYRNKYMDYSVRIPLAFWKVCALVRADGTLSATAFLLSQDDVSDLPGFDEKFDVVPTQVTLAELEKKTGLVFPGLRTHDHFAKGGAPGTLELDTEEGPRRVLPIRSFEDIVV